MLTDRRYWDWTKDTKNGGSLANSPVFDPTTGFGGDGVPGTYTIPTDSDGSVPPYVWITDFVKGCVGTGPFTDVVRHVGPGKRFTDHCIVRGFDGQAAAAPTLSTAYVNILLSENTYDNFWNRMDGIPFKTEIRTHDAGHIALGGEMVSAYTSTNGTSSSLYMTS